MAECKKENRADIMNLYYECYSGLPTHDECCSDLENILSADKDTESASKEHTAIVERLKECGRITHNECMRLSDTLTASTADAEATGFVMGFEYAVKLLTTQ